MSYDHRTIALRVEAGLRANPRLTLAVLSREFQIDRHTIERAVFKILGVKFKVLKAAVQDEAISAALVTDDLISIKQAAAKIGYGSTSSLAKRTRRTMGVAPAKVRRRHRS